jgi:hypothetical protein
LIRFLIALFIVSLALFAGGYFVFESLPKFFYHSIIFLFISTAGLYKFLLETKHSKPDLFVPIYLSTLMVKLIAYGGYIFVMVKKQPEMKAENVVFFMIGYVIFTGLETGFLYRSINR